LGQRAKRDTGAGVITQTAISVAAFREVLQSFLRQSETLARAVGLTPQQYLLLLMIKGAPDGLERTTVTEIAKRLHLAPNTVSELATRTQEAGLLARSGSASDARVAELRLTTKGDRLVCQVMRTHVSERQVLLDRLVEVTALNGGDAEPITPLVRDTTDQERIEALSILDDAYLGNLNRLERENRRLKQMLGEKELENDKLRQYRKPERAPKPAAADARKR
jgi:DNA-binding MarR family transcriptional regulator